MKKVYIDAKIVCWKRSLDANKIKNYFIRNNYKVVNTPEDAEIIIFVTCAFLNYTTDFWLKRIKEFKKYNAELIVAGCLPDIDGKELNKIFDGKVITTKHIEKIDDFFPDNKIKFNEIEDSNTIFKNEEKSNFVVESLKKISRRIKFLEKIYLIIYDFILKNVFSKNSIEYRFSKKQFIIRISWGCLGNCSYCAIKKAVGKLLSKSTSDCIEEFKKGLSSGNKNFVLEADDLGAYGQDINSSFSNLLDELTKIQGDYEITIRGLHPVWIVKYADELDVILKRGKIPIIEVALQSANDRILKLMNRYSDVETIRKSILKLRNAFPDIIFSAEIIMGFPTETMEEFMSTLSFIKEIGLRSGHIYLFSLKNGTDAEKIEPKISSDELNKRALCVVDHLRKEGYYVRYIKSEKFIIFTKRK